MVVKPQPKINQEECIGCAQCVEICPKNILEIEKGTATVEKPELCDRKWGCIETCPTGAMRKSQN